MLIPAESLAWQSIDQVKSLLRRRDVSVMELTAVVLDRIEALNPNLNCFITVLRDRAMEQAKALERLLRSGVDLGPLHGIPIALKDNVETADIRTTVGSRILADWVPTSDATVARRLKAAGAVLLGKLNMYEFAYGTWHVDYGETRNPWDHSRCCAGSSSGPACAVAAGLTFGSIGSDTGCSIRLPAAVCGVAGLKPTYGLVSRAGVFPASPNLDHVGPLGRSVADVAVLMDAIAGFDPRDPTSVDVSVQGYRAALIGDLRGIVVGVPQRQPGELIDREMQDAIEAALEVLQDQGAQLVEVVVPDHLTSRTLMWTISSAEVAEYHRSFVRSKGDQYSPVVRELIQNGEFLPATDYVHAQRVRQKVRKAYEGVMRQVDFLALPVTPIPAFPVGASQAVIEGQEEELWPALTRYCPPFNITGQPALSVLCGFNSVGLPLSLQIVGKWLDDAAVLRVGHVYEQATTWHSRRPELKV